MHSKSKDSAWTLEFRDWFDAGEEVHLAVCHMREQDMVALGGWNSKQVSVYDIGQDCLQMILQFQSQNTFSLSNISYVDSLRLILVGDCFSQLCVYRYSDQIFRV